MSWIWNPEGDGGGRTAQRRPARSQRNSDSSNSAQPDIPAFSGQELQNEDVDPKVHDPAFPDRMVSSKQANRPFLGYTEYRKQQEKEHEAWLHRKKEREVKLARGEQVGPEEPDPTDEPEVGCLGLLKFLLYAAIIIVLAGKFITGSFLWEHDLPNIRKLIPTNQRLFSERMLATFDGSDESKPVYLAIDGDVYDVSAGRLTYGPGGPYHMLAGKDAARAYGTGCFSTHLTHDLRGLSDEELKGVEHWKQFYAGHKKYVKIGRVSHPPIDPTNPIPEHCEPKKAKAKRTPDQVGKMKERTSHSRDEL